MSTDSNEPLLTPNQVAQALDVAPVTVRQWAQKGLLPARVTAGGHRRFERAAVVAFAHARGMHLSGELRTNAANRVLVVDDDRQFNGFLVQLLRTEQSQLEIASAFDGFDAGRMVQRHRPALVLLDIMMPGLDGVEVCRRVRQKTRIPAHIRIVIAMTGHLLRGPLDARVLAAWARSACYSKPFGDGGIVHAACGWRADRAGQSTTYGSRAGTVIT